MELETAGTEAAIGRRMSSQRNKVHHVYTAAHVARQLGVGEGLIHDLIPGLEPEDGMIWVYGLDDGLVHDLGTTVTNRAEGAAAYQAALAAL